MSIINDMKYKYVYASPVMKLIIVNAAVFIVSAIINLFLWAIKGNTGFLLSLLALPSHPIDFLYKPWTIITYQFTHFGIFHILFNMLVLNTAGYIFMDYFKKQEVWRVYILGGVVAGVVFALTSNLIPAMQVGALHVLYGASASVMAIVFAATTYAPNIRLYLFGSIQIKLLWFALFFLLVDLVSIPESNAGGHISHLGGALFGWLYALHKKGRLTILKSESYQSPKAKSRHLKVEVNQSNKINRSAGKDTSNRVPSQEEVDAILDKISKSGYDRLTKEEKDILFKASQD
jgi:membrane associated rhomboid family serine protease